MLMTFEEFQKTCKYMQYGCDQMGSHEFYETCRKPDMIPQGHSWGICDKNHCPFVPEEEKTVFKCFRCGNTLLETSSENGISLRCLDCHIGATAPTAKEAFESYNKVWIPFFENGKVGVATALPDTFVKIIHEKE